MPNGYNGKILRVNLTDGKVWTESPDTLTYRRYVGGSALALYYLLKHLPKGVDPLGPDNLLVFTTSVICGQPIPGASRFTAAAKSPLTGAFGESEAGGWWGPELKKAGFDAILIQGRAAKAVYLWIHDGQAEIKDASKLWGMVTGDSQAGIRAELGDDKVRVAQIGPAGEKRVRFSCIINELRHVNGRTGMGAVMGSKQLKAIAVRGTQKLPVGDEEGLKACQKWFRSHYQRQPADMHDLGTPRLVTSLDADGILPTRNFIKGHFDKAQDIGAKRMKETMFVGAGTCYGCPIACKREVKVAEGPYQVDPKYGGPEYETLAAFGSLCEVADQRAVAKANQICGEYTLDTISTGAVVAFAFECYEHGILTKADTGGLDLTWGNAQAMVKLTEMIAKRDGIGDALAEGVKRAAAKFGKGAEKYALHVKGQELPMHEARGKRLLTLSYSTSPTGADHVESPHDPFFESCNPDGNHAFGPVGLLEPVDRLDLGPKKLRAFLFGQRTWGLYNCIGMCNFVGVPIGPLALDALTDYVRAVTGWRTTLEELYQVAERSFQMARVFNYREGFTQADDTLPDRLFEPLQEGKIAGHKLDRAEFQRALKLYYQMVGWDAETGLPTQAKLAELGIEWIADCV